ncbi:pyruvate formate lyase family protein [Brenneria populi]|uniref:Pyruvate formate lyase family protein n=1 Tax=Brenneria populi TaxID=1505588 RepID=A0ABU6JKU3_9GAMM|nr:pyruvate formate lyase family protein [Brenneria populi Li et al. 2015]
MPLSGNALLKEEIELSRSVFDADGKLTYEEKAERALQAALKIKDQLLDSPQRVDTERLSHLLDVYQKYGTEPAILLRARVFEQVLQKKTLFLDNNPLVGAVTSYPAGVYVYPEYGSEWIAEELDQPIVSHLGEVSLSSRDRELLAEAAAYFQDKNAEARSRELARELLGFDPKEGVAAGLFTESARYTVGAGNVDYTSFIDRGLKEVIRETEARLRTVPRTAADSDRIDYYQASLITLKAVIALAHRYADLAESEAGKTGDPIRRAELLEIAEVARHVPENPPRNFREALQSWWFIHLGIQIEQSGCGSSPGRLGQYLDKYYQADKNQNGLTAAQAKSWLKALFVKILSYGFYSGVIAARQGSGHTGHTINLGGLDASGRDATTELDYILLDTQIELQTIQPTITILYHDGLAEDFLLKAVDLERTGLGQPQWLNNRVAIERLLTRYANVGVTIEDARNCINMSCVATGIAGKTAFLHEGGSFNLAKALELAFHDGVDPATGLTVGAKTGDPRNFADFEQLYAAYSQQVLHLFQQIRPLGSLSNKVLGDTVPVPFRSSLYEGSRRRGRDIYKGGADYYLYFVISTAGVDVANSLAALKQVIYDDKETGWDELLAALAANFEGHEALHGKLLKAPKHGNGDAETDALIRRVYDDAWTLFHSLNDRDNFFGDNGANLEAFSLSIHNYFGILTGALPNGRKKGAPLTDASVSATPGSDRKGPLALLASAAQALDTVKYGSNHFNMKFHPQALAGIGGARKLLALIKDYMDRNGSHIQFNVVSSETLRKAQANPEDYKGLTVRVAGFSAYFTRLHKGVQDEIIARTELSF